MKTLFTLISIILISIVSLSAQAQEKISIDIAKDHIVEFGGSVTKGEFSTVIIIGDDMFEIPSNESRVTIKYSSRLNTMVIYSESSNMITRRVIDLNKMKITKEDYKPTTK